MSYYCSDMRTTIYTLLALAIFLLGDATVSYAQSRAGNRIGWGPVNNRGWTRVNVHVYDGDRSSIRYRSGPSSTRSSSPSPCFPHGCGGISGPFRNPDPDARKPENLTKCIYGRDGFLLYEREGKVCPYEYVDANTRRVEARRQEWLRAQAEKRRKEAEARERERIQLQKLQERPEHARRPARTVRASRVP